MTITAISAIGHAAAFVSEADVKNTAETARFHVLTAITDRSVPAGVVPGAKVNVTVTTGSVPESANPVSMEISVTSHAELTVIQHVQSPMPRVTEIAMPDFTGNTVIRLAVRRAKVHVTRHLANVLVSAL